MDRIAFLRCVMLAGVVVPWVLGTTARGQAHPFSVHDMLAMDRISDPQVSPDNERVVFVRRTTDLDSNRGRTDLWVVDLDGTNLRRMTAAPENDWNPRWSADGEWIYFLSNRGGSSQVWRIAADGGEATAVTDLPLEVGSMIMSPTGEHIAFSMEVFVGRTPEETRKRLDEREADPATGRVYTKLFVRHWDRWEDGRRSHVFVMPIGGGKVVDVMKHMDADCPTQPFGGPEDYTFSPDGRWIVFTARDVGREEAWSTNFDLFRSAIDGSMAPECLTELNKAWDTHPVFSPDGKKLAYLAMREPGYESDQFNIMVADWPIAAAVQVLTVMWDRSPGSITWSADGNEIYATAANLGQRSLFAVDSKWGKVRTVVEKGTIGSVQAAGDRALFGMDTLQSPVELYTVRPDGEDVRRVTRINDKKVAAARMGEAEQFTFKGWNDETVHAYVVKPVDFDESKKYPVAFLIHGGPQGSFGNHFHYRWNPQAYAGARYAAVMVDFHGSTGYGQAFTDSIRDDWGGKPLVDLQKGLEAALERYAWMDGERVAALGASFGGFMINWIAGVWPERFRCLVNHDGNLDERAAYFNTDELWFPEWDHKGTPWESPDGYIKHNPVEFVANWKTPMLVIHGAGDYRVVETQGIATFNALQRLGVPSKFLYFPDENHWVLKPHNSILWHETVIDWLDRWTKNEG